MSKDTKVKTPSAKSIASKKIYDDAQTKRAELAAKQAAEAIVTTTEPDSMKTFLEAIRIESEADTVRKLLNPSDNSKSLVDTLSDNGLFPPDLIRGELLRFAGIGKNDSNKAAYLFIFGDGNGAVYGDFSCNLHATWQANIGREFTKEEKRNFAIQQQAARDAMARELAEKHHNGKIRAIQLWENATVLSAQLEHPYLIKKKIQPHNTKASNGVLYIPLYGTDLELCSLQLIQSNGDKSFLKGGKIKGSFSVIGEQLNTTDKILICEGFATGASLQEDTGHFTVCAMSANNLESVAKTFKSFYPQATFIICGDNDENSVGQLAAEKAARAIGCAFIVPEQSGMDFNDVFNLEG